MSGRSEAQSCEKQLQLLDLGVPVGEPEPSSRQVRPFLRVEDGGEVAHHLLQQHRVVRQASKVETHVLLVTRGNPRIQQNYNSVRNFD